MGKIWQLVAVTVVGLGVGLTLGIVGCDSSPQSGKDKMGAEKMDGGKMKDDRMKDDKMKDDKMKDDKK